MMFILILLKVLISENYSISNSRFIGHDIFNEQFIDPCVKLINQNYEKFTNHIPDIFIQI